MVLEIGQRVIVRDKKSKWDEEPGVVISKHPPLAEVPDTYGVHVAGWDVLFPPENLEVDVAHD